MTYLCWPVSDGEMSAGPFPPLGLNYIAALPTATPRRFSNSFLHRSPPQSKGKKPLTDCCSPPLIQKDASQLQLNHQERLWYRCIIRNESSFMGRKERQEDWVALKFQGSKNKGSLDSHGSWWESVGGRLSTTNYSWAADWSLGCRRLTLAPVNQHKWLQNHPPQTVSVILQPQVSVGPLQTVTRAAAVLLIYLNFGFEAAFESFGLC